MGIRERREREKDATRQKILDAARDLFAKQGYDAVSLRRIASVIEYSPTTIYLYFKDKADLMKRLCSEDFAAFTAQVSQYAGVTDPVERIRMSGRIYIRFAMEHPEHFRLMFMTKPAPELVEVDEEELTEQGKGDPSRDAYAFLKNCVDEAIAQGKVRQELQGDPELVTQMLWAALHGVASLQNARPENDPWFEWKGATKLGEAMSDAVLRGILRENPRRPLRSSNGRSRSRGSQRPPKRRRKGAGV